MTLDPDWITAELRRAKALLSLSRTGVQLSEAPVDPPARDVGAVAGVGLRSVLPHVRADIYIFDDGDAGEVAIQQFASEVPASGTTSNGAMIAVVTASDDALLRRLLSAFAGDE